MDTHKHENLMWLIIVLNIKKKYLKNVLHV